MSSVMSVSRAEIAGLSDIVAMEREPYEKAVPFHSTAALLDYAVSSYGATTAVHFQEDADPDGAYMTWTFDAFQRQCIRAAHLFRSLGVQREEPVALLVPHIPSALFALWGRKWPVALSRSITCWVPNILPNCCVKRVRVWW